MEKSDENEIKRAADKLMNDYGEEAGRYAAMRLADVRRGGDAEIITYWRDIIAEINKRPKKSKVGSD